jgi:hypothetical protein
MGLESDPGILIAPKGESQMKKVGVLLLLVALLVLPTAALADLPGGGWWSGEQIQNVGDDVAHVVVTSYDASSSATYTANYDIPVGGAHTFLPSEFGHPAGFQGSAVAEADQSVKAVVNVTNRLAGGYGTAGGLAAAQYQGIEAPANTVNFPLAKINHYGKTTTFYIQNAGSAPTTTGTATFRMRSGATHTYSLPAIGAGQMILFTAQDAGANPNDTNNDAKIGSLTVAGSDQPLAGIVMEHFHVETPATILQGARGFTAADFDTTLYAPVAKNNRGGRFTGIQVQNVSGASINISVTYKGTAGACAGMTYTDGATGLADGASKTFLGTTVLPSNCTAAGTIVGTGNIVAIVNESFLTAYIPPEGQQSTTYNAFPASMASQVLSVPLYKENRFNKTTGLQVQNTSATSNAHVTLEFVCGTTTYTTNVQTIAPGAGANFTRVSQNPGLWAGTVMPEDVNCAVTVTSADQNIVGMANESVFPFSGAPIQQDKSNYEGFNLP